MSRLTIDLTDYQHQSLKALAALQGKTIKQYAIERMLPGKVDSDEAWEQLKTLLRSRIDAVLAGKVSAKSVDEILEEELAGVDPA
ncbi:MAG: antitoxin [Burkholderiaceae bacterium]|jgi:aryl-alcohol dehydrogenase-like predicted oxidoreductase|nr:antitoxin [Burkholderiaceae bacterium]